MFAGQPVVPLVEIVRITRPVPSPDTGKRRQSRKRGLGGELANETKWLKRLREVCTARRASLVILEVYKLGDRHIVWQPQEVNPPEVAVWLTGVRVVIVGKSETHQLGCDAWTQWSDNLASIVRTLEALTAIEDAGILKIRLPNKPYEQPRKQSEHDFTARVREAAKVYTWQGTATRVSDEEAWASFWRSFDERSEQASQAKPPPRARANGAMTRDAALAFLWPYADGPILGMDLESLRKAYRRAAKKLHPDVGGSDESFKQLQKAREVLGIR